MFDAILCYGSEDFPVLVHKWIFNHSSYVILFFLKQTTLKYSF